jgi:outer membrane receptor for Fe3+-dicitrate
VVVQLTDNDGAVLPLTDNQGIFTVPAATAPGGDNYETWHENIAAIFLSDTYTSDKWVLTAGGRVAEDWVHGYYHLTKNVDMDANPNTLYNNFGQIFLPQTQRLEYKNTLRSWMVGATFLINDTSSIYSNISYGVAPNHFDTIRSIPQAANVVQTIHSYVIGYRFATSHLFLSVEGFHRQFLHDNAVFNLADGSTVLSFGQGQRANGVLAQLRAGPFKGFSVSLVADAQDGRLIDPSCQEFVNQAGQQVCHSSSGEHPNRQPNFQYVVRPEYRADLPFGFLELWASFNHVGYHTATADASLGMYNDIGIGAQLGVGEHWRFTLRGTNVTDNIGLTEGNARIFAGAQNLGGVILARGIEGHEYNLQIRYSF